MREITPVDLHHIYPMASADICKAWAPHISAALATWSIDTIDRAAAIFGQFGWESCQLTMLVESADKAKNYEGRKDLGNFEPGDGVRFGGRGWPHLTGRRNYAKAGKVCDPQRPEILLDHPELAALPEYSANIAGWFWWSHGLNALADRRDYWMITKRINGGHTDYENRVLWIKRARTVLEAIGYGRDDREPGEDRADER